MTRDTLQQSQNFLCFLLKQHTMQREKANLMTRPIGDQALKVHRYWLREGEPPLGYATHKRYPIIGFIGATILGVIALFFLAQGLQTIGALIAGLVALFWLITFLMGWRYSGWYEVDNNGHPQTFVSHAPLPGISVISGINRQTFLQDRRRFY
jgi:hypothetical protein